jgi:hypothetical protein
MKNLKNIAVVLVAMMLSFSAIAQNAFEGEIRVTTSNKDLNETATVNLMLKGGNTKMVFNTVTKGEAYTYTIIINANNSLNAVMLTEVQGKKARYDIPLSSLNNPALAIYYKFTETGVTESAIGYTTNQVVIEAPGTTTMCKVADVKGLKPADLPLLFKMGGVMKAFADKNYNGIPLSITTLDSRTGDIKFTQNIDSITPRPIGDNEFVVGAEWVKPN